jgi:protocatechuate 3,4-dioxygenase alpha subunit
MPPITPSQTVGPFFAMRLPWTDGPDVVPAGTPDAITIRGQVFDGAGAIIPDALIETWQAAPDGSFDHPDDKRAIEGKPGTFRGFGRCETDVNGEYHVTTLKPGPLPALVKGVGEVGGGTEAPHLDVSVFARGLLDRVVTRIYFPDEPEANAADPVLASITEPGRRETLIAAPTPDGGLRFDIRLQGDRETVFFEV